jgi:hypothetical protein
VEVRHVAGVKLLQAQGVKEIPRSAAERAGRELDNARPLQPTGRPKKGVAHTPLPKGTSSKRLAARISRDHPEIAARVKAGEFRSMRAAAIAAGIVRVPSALEVAQKAYRKLGPKERAAFLAWVNQQ